MAPADAGDFRLDADDDDFFGEYNPHPYQGGYNLAATFGDPLPPSSNICYPVSSSSSAADTAAVPAITPSPPSPAPPKPEDPRPVEPHGDEKAQRDLAHEIPDGAAREGKVRRGRRSGFRKKFVRVLDWLFCYKDPYKERGIVVDSYVVPVCTIRKERGEDALSVEIDVAPPSVGIVEAGDATGELVQVQTNVGNCFLNAYLLTSAFYLQDAASSLNVWYILCVPSQMHCNDFLEEFVHHIVMRLQTFSSIIYEEIRLSFNYVPDVYFADALTTEFAPNFLLV